MNFSDLFSNPLGALAGAAVVIGTLIFLLLAVSITRRFLRRLTAAAYAYDKDILLIRVPKETPKDLEKDFTKQALLEDIAAAESIFVLIGGLKANPNGFTSWLFGANNTFSFEIVASKKLISFYIVVPKKQRRFIEQEIYAHYPAASIEETADYNIFTPKSETSSATLVLKRSSMFPVRTYKKMET